LNVKQVPQAFVREATGLVRQITTADAVIINLVIANLVIGSVGLLVLPYTLPGVNLIYAVLVAAATSFALSIVYWLFNVAMPRSGGDYVYNTRSLFPSIGFAANFSLTIWTIFYIAAYASFVASLGLSGWLTTLGTIDANAHLVSLGNYFGTLNGEFITATIVNIVMALLVITGLRLTLNVLRVLFVVAIVGTVTAILLIAVSTHAQFVNAFNAYANYQAVITSANTSGVFPTVSNWNQLGPSLLGVGFASETLIFFQYSSYVGGEIRNARKAAPFALIGALGILVVLVLIMAWGFTNTIGVQFLGAIYALFYSGSASYPLSVPPSLVLFAGILAGHNQLLLNLMGVGITAWSLAIVPFLYLTMSRNVMAWSFDRILPERLSRVSSRFHSPTYAIVFAFILSQLFLIPYTYVAQFVQFFAASTAGLVIDFFIVSISAIFFPLRKTLYANSGIQSKKIGPFPLISFVGVIATVFIAVLLYGFFTQPGFLIYVPGNALDTIIGSLVAVSLFITGFVVFYVSKFSRKSHGIDLEIALKEIPPE
jgi:basic amino acid/polyamine antiporter, APA family